MQADPLSDPATPAAPKPTAGQTNYFGRLVAYIPAEVIAVYQALAGPMGASASAAKPAAEAGTNVVGNPGNLSDLATNTDAIGNTTGVLVKAASAAGQDDKALISLGLILLALTPVWIYFTTKDKGEPAPWHQIVISTLAFFVWLLAVSNPIVGFWREWQPLYGTVAMILAAGIVFPLLEMMFKKR